MIATLVFVAIDTVVLLLFVGLSLDWIFDYVFHAWIVFCLARGISSHKKLKELPEEDELAEVITEETVAVEDETPAE